MRDFVCWSCRKVKKIELKGQERSKGRIICTYCVSKIKPPTLINEEK